MTRQNNSSTAREMVETLLLRDLLVNRTGPTQE
jgi:hypothetical protein